MLPKLEFFDHTVCFCVCVQKLIYPHFVMGVDCKIYKKMQEKVMIDGLASQIMRNKQMII